MQIDSPPLPERATEAPALFREYREVEQHDPLHRPSVSLPRVLGQFALRWMGPAAIALLLFEGLIRSFIYSPRPQVVDPVLGPMPAPGSVWVNGREGFGRVHWNQQGVRGRDLPPAGSGVPRIIVMGDSYTRSEATHDGQTYADLLERQLSHRLGRDVWVGNCGRPGNDAADFLYHLPAYEEKFRPDLVLIAFTLSDFRLVDGHILPGVSARFDPTATGGRELTIQPSAEGTDHDLLRRYLPGRVAGLAQTAIDQSSLSLYGAARLYAATVKEPVEARAATSIEHIATTEQMERYLATLVARLESPVACAYINPWSPLLAETNGVFDRVAEQRLQAAAARLKIPMVATGAAVQAYVRQTGQPINGFHKTERGPGEGHLNPAGHRLMASCLAPVMARLLSSELRLRELRVAQYQAGAPVRARSRPDQGRA